MRRNRLVLSRDRLLWDCCLARARPDVKRTQRYVRARQPRRSCRTRKTQTHRHHSAFVNRRDGYGIRSPDVGVGAERRGDSPMRRPFAHERPNSTACMKNCLAIFSPLENRNREWLVNARRRSAGRVPLRAAAPRLHAHARLADPLAPVGKANVPAMVRPSAGGPSYGDTRSPVYSMNTASTLWPSGSSRKAA